ncbi:MAG: pseudouridine synthase [Bacteroidota bacterium]|nr:pseudouridine synthase [Bacteroidota bacterium]
MRNDYSSHNWERRDDENYRNGKERNSRPRVRRDFEDKKENRFEKVERRNNSYNREERPFNRERKPFNRNENSNYRERKTYGGEERRPYGNRERKPFNRDENRYEGKERVYNSRPYSQNRRNNGYGNNDFETKPKRPRLLKEGNGRVRKEKGPNFTPPNPENVGKTRLNKYISNAGICSRREADILISTGAITVNGQVITEMGYKVVPGDVVKYNGTELKSEKKVYLLLNKPKGYITTSDDPFARKTVMDLIGDACSERVYPVGRLDRNTTGLLLFTNDGDLTKKLTHPSYGAQKVYNVELDNSISKADMYALLKGVELEDGFEKVDAINYTNNEPIDKRKVGVSIHSGKNRIIRRLFESLGYEVVKLDRVYFAGLTKKNLLRGHYRFLTEKEVAFLKMNKQ